MFFKNRNKEIIDKQLENYKNKNLNEINSEAIAKAKELNDAIAKLAQQCAEQTAEYEHTFHNNKEEKGIILAELTQKIINQEDKLSYLNEMIKLKEEALQKQINNPNWIDERERLYSIIDKLLGKNG